MVKLCDYICTVKYRYLHKVMRKKDLVCETKIFFWSYSPEFCSVSVKKRRTTNEIRDYGKSW